MAIGILVGIKLNNTCRKFMFISLLITIAYIFIDVVTLCLDLGQIKDISNQAPENNEVTINESEPEEVKKFNKLLSSGKLGNIKNKEVEKK